MSNHDIDPTGKTTGVVPLARIVSGIALAVILVAAGFGLRAAWSDGNDPEVDPPVASSGDVGGTAPLPEDRAGDRAGDRAAAISTTGRRAPAISPPVVALPPDDVPDATALFGTRVVAVSYRDPATVVTRDGARFRVGDALPSGAILDAILPGRLSVRVDGVETILDPARGNASRLAPD